MDINDGYDECAGAENPPYCYCTKWWEESGEEDGISFELHFACLTFVFKPDYFETTDKEEIETILGDPAKIDFW